MAHFEEIILNFFLSYSAEPIIVYTAIAILMTMGSFGLPISEEIVIISAGLMAYVGSHPELYPPVKESANFMTIHTTALVCFLSVFLSDFLVFNLGRFLNNSMKNKYIDRLVSPKKMEKISKWVNRYGYLYPAVFRFLPGLRFPGHLSSGFFKIPFSQFILVDGLAALLTVPTQVIVIGIFGQSIIEHLKIFISALAFLMIAFIILFILKKTKEIKQFFTR